MVIQESRKNESGKQDESGNHGAITVILDLSRFPCFQMELG
jgi:hypothetical protein